MKPTRVTIDPLETLAKVFSGVRLIKDLQDHQRVCNACGGLGIRRSDLTYGLRGGDPGFPYHQQHIALCGCVFGILMICEFCDVPFASQFVLQCDCDGATKARHAKWALDAAEKRAKLPRIQLSEYDGEMLWDDGADGFVSTDDVKTGEYYACETSEEWLSPPNADLVIEQLSEEAYDEVEDSENMVDISDAAKAKLQSFLDSWFTENVRVKKAFFKVDTIVVVPEPESESE